MRWDVQGYDGGGGVSCYEVGCRRVWGLVAMRWDVEVYDGD